MREGTNERTNEQTYTTTKHITTLLLRSRIKRTKSYEPKGMVAALHEINKNKRSILSAPPECGISEPTLAPLSINVIFV